MRKIIILKRNFYAQTDDNGSIFRIINVIDKKNIVNLFSNTVDFRIIVDLLNNGFENLENLNISMSLLELLKKMLKKKDLFFSELDEDLICKERILKNQLINIYNTSNLEKVDFQSYINQFENQKIFIYDESSVGNSIFIKLKNDKFKAYVLSESTQENIDESSIILLNLLYKEAFLKNYKSIKNKILCYCTEFNKIYIGPIIIKDTTGCLLCRQYEDIKGINNNINANYFSLEYIINLLYFFLVRNILFLVDGVNKYIIKDVGLVINKQLEVDLMTSRAVAKSFIIDPSCSCKE